jgi:hypothetical protein
MIRARMAGMGRICTDKNKKMNHGGTEAQRRKNF